MKTVNEQILIKLSELEHQHKIRILLACETGSRGWGFPSPDSDYDVRFIYIHEPNWYISVNEQEDQISVPINDELDITGWELRKCLQLLIKHNAALMERLQSPIIYTEKPLFKEEFFHLAQSYFSSVSVMHHYLSMAKSYLEKCDLSENIKLKSLFYCIRTTLCCHWIYEYHSLPPMELKKLLKVVSEKKELTARILELVRLKSTQAESYLHHAEPLILSYLKETLQRCEEGTKSLPSQKYPIVALNAFLHKHVLS